MSILEEPILGKNPEEVFISNSELQTYKRCRRRWYLGYYLALKPKKDLMIGPLPLGTRVHNALERYYTDGTHPSDEYNRLLRIDTRKFEGTDEAAFPEHVDTFNSEAELGRLIIEGYMEWLEETNEDASIEVIAAEAILSHRLSEFDPRVTLIGKVDLKVRRAFDQAVVIFDHKTAAASGMGDYLKYAAFSEQLMMYVLLERINHVEGEPKVSGGTYNLLKKVKRTGNAKPPFYGRVDVRFNQKTLNSFWIRTIGTVRDIMRTRDELDEGQDHRFVAYPTQKMDWSCGTCPFYKVCAMMDDGSDAESMIENLYVQGDPNARYQEDQESTI